MAIQHVNAISNRLSLRPPQRDSLEILSRVCEIVSLPKGGDPAAALQSGRVGRLAHGILGPRVTRWISACPGFTTCRAASLFHFFFARRFRGQARPPHGPRALQPGSSYLLP